MSEGGDLTPASSVPYPYGCMFMFRRLKERIRLNVYQPRKVV